MPSFIPRPLVIGAAALVALSAASPAAFANEYRDQLVAQLQQARALAKQAGMRTVAGPFFDQLDEGASETYTLPVQRGKTYLIGGVCDTDCSDLDIKILNDAGETIGEDTLEDDAPVVELVPSASGTVTIEVTMFACSAEPCHLAVEVFGN
jgi:hypothetical protein